MNWPAQRRLLLSLVIIFLAFALSLWDIDGRSLWFDEGMEYWVATSSIEDMPHNVRRGIQDPPLYSLLLHLWMKLGRDEFHLRFLSVIFSLLGTVGIIKLGHLLGGSKTGLAAGTIMAVLPTQIRYAQEVGQYALMGCLLVWNLITLYYVCERSSWTTYLLWIMSALAATYSYYGTAFIISVTFGIEVLRSIIHKKWQRFTQGLSVIALYGIGIIPLLVFFLPSQLYRGATTDAFHIVFSSPLRELQDFAVSTQNLVAFVFSGWPWTSVSKWVSSSLVAVLLIQSFYTSRRSSVLKMWWLWLTSTWAAYYAVNKFNVFPYKFRYGLIMVPLLVPAIAAGSYSVLSERREQVIGTIGRVLLILVCILSLPNLAFRSILHPGKAWGWPETEDVRQVVEYWLDNGGATNATYVYYGAAPAFSYYLERYGIPQSLPPVWYAECWQGHASSYCAKNDVYYGRWLRALTPERKVQAILETLSGKPKTLWLIFSHVYPGEDDTILNGLLDDYNVTQSYASSNAHLYLLQRRDE